MLKVNCKICGSEFYAKPRHLKIGWGKYCSKVCQYESQKTGKYIPCNVCGSKVWRMQRSIRHSQSQNFFCTKSCQTVWRNKIYSGPSHSFWKSGIRVYRQILIRSGIKIFCRLCETNDYRILAVHHIDKNRKNNALTNLTWLCHNCHYLIHHDKKEMNKLMKILNNMVPMV
jgi:hypothetical protein